MRRIQSILSVDGPVRKIEYLPGFAFV